MHHQLVFILLFSLTSSLDLNPKSGSFLLIPDVWVPLNGPVLPQIKESASLYFRCSEDLERVAQFSEPSLCSFSTKGNFKKLNSYLSSLKAKLDGSVKVESLDLWIHFLIEHPKNNWVSFEASYAPVITLETNQTITSIANSSGQRVKVLEVASIWRHPENFEVFVQATQNISFSYEFVGNEMFITFDKDNQVLENSEISVELLEPQSHLRSRKLVFSLSPSSHQGSYFWIIFFGVLSFVLFLTMVIVLTTVDFSRKNEPIQLPSRSMQAEDNQENSFRLSRSIIDWKGKVDEETEDKFDLSRISTKSKIIGEMKDIEFSPRVEFDHIEKIEYLEVSQITVDNFRKLADLSIGE